MASHAGGNIYGCIAFIALVAFFDLLVKDSFIQQLQQQQVHRDDDWRANLDTKTHANPSFAPVDIFQQSVASITASNEHHHNLWDNSTTIPAWMKEYFTWHHDALQTLNEDNWQSYHYFLYRCVPADKKCSGTSDRLKAVPALLLLAHQSQPRRLLFIYWSRPARLEEFLVPPTGGMNWSVPSWLAHQLNVEQQGPKYFFESTRDFDHFPKYADAIARVKNVRGSEFYERSRNETELTFDQVYHAVWNVLFQPSSAIAALVEKELQEMQLQPGHYVAAHVRARYLSDTVDRHEEINAIHCARAMRPGWPIFVASDSMQTTQAAVAYGQGHKWNVVARRAERDPLHLDRGHDFLMKSEDWKGRPATDFYDVFVDFYLLVQSRCVAYGSGGFGSWASLVAGTQDCSINHRSQNCSAS